MNEIAAPFLIFLKHGITLPVIYEIFGQFIAKFMLRVFNDKDFLTLEAGFALFIFLLKYHDPELSAFLSEREMTPELYTIP